MPESWTVEEAKTKLSEIMRLARVRGPQVVGRKRSCVVVSSEAWDALNKPKQSFTSWLVENTPVADDFKLPDRAADGERPNPFGDVT